MTISHDHRFLFPWNRDTRFLKQLTVTELIQFR